MVTQWLITQWLTQWLRYLVIPVCLLHAACVACQLLAAPISVNEEGIQGRDAALKPHLDNPRLLPALSVVHVLIKAVQDLVNLQYNTMQYRTTQCMTAQYMH
jgi:hypothetical protein